MQTSSFQQVLMGALALVLGFSLASSNAVGYPSGPSVSLGSNPVVSVAGRTELIWDAPHPVLTVPSDQRMVITDLHFAIAEDHISRCQFQLRGSDGTVFASHWVHGYQSSDGEPLPELVVERSLKTGIAVPAGTELQLRPLSSFCEAGSDVFHYNISGYYAQP